MQNNLEHQPGVLILNVSCHHIIFKFPVYLHKQNHKQTNSTTNILCIGLASGSLLNTQSNSPHTDIFTVKIKIVDRWRSFKRKNTNSFYGCDGAFFYDYPNHSLSEGCSSMSNPVPVLLS